MPVRPPSLRAISAFEAAARHESFVKAAEELNLTQSAISHSIRGLEERLDARLFARRGRNVALTAEGRSLADRLRVSLTLLAQALEGVTPSEQVESLVIAAPSAFAHQVLIRRWRMLTRDHPAICLELRPDLGVRAVQSGEADLCIDYGAGAYAGLASRAMARDAIFPVAAPGFAVDPDRLDAAELIENTDHAWALWFANAPLEAPARSPALTVRDWGLAVEAAKAGLGVCLASESLVAHELASGALVRVGTRSAPAAYGCYVVWRAHGPKVRLVSRFVDWLLEQAPLQGDSPGATTFPGVDLSGPRSEAA